MTARRAATADPVGTPPASLPPDARADRPLDGDGLIGIAPRLVHRWRDLGPARAGLGRRDRRRSGAGPAAGVRPLRAGVDAPGRPGPDGAAGARRGHGADTRARSALPVGGLRRQRGRGPPPRTGPPVPPGRPRPGPRRRGRDAGGVGARHRRLPGHLGLGGVPAARAHRRGRGGGGAGRRRVHDGGLVAREPRQLEHRRVPPAAVRGAVLVRGRRRRPAAAARHRGHVVHDATAPGGRPRRRRDRGRRPRPAGGHLAPHRTVAGPGQPPRPHGRRPPLCPAGRGALGPGARPAGLRGVGEPGAHRLVRPSRRPARPRPRTSAVAGCPRARAPPAARARLRVGALADQPAHRGHLAVGRGGGRRRGRGVPAVADGPPATGDPRPDGRGGVGGGAGQRLVGPRGPRTGAAQLLPLDVRPGLLRGAGARARGGRARGPAGPGRHRRPTSRRLGDRRPHRPRGRGPRPS